MEEAGIIKVLPKFRLCETGYSFIAYVGIFLEQTSATEQVLNL